MVEAVPEKSPVNLKQLAQRYRSERRNNKSTRSRRERRLAEVEPDEVPVDSVIKVIERLGVWVGERKAGGEEHLI